MDAKRLDEILEAFPRLSIAVIGDFFLDKYLEIDPALQETSLETGLAAHQAVAVRCYPGAAGTVVNNLVALGVGHIYPIGFTGADGEGFDLRRGLLQPGVNLADLLETTERMTPAYIKPLVIQPGKPPRELARIDAANRAPLPGALEDDIITHLEQRVGGCEGLIVQDQVEAKNVGVITDTVRERIAQLGDELPDKVFFADSRCRIGDFRSVIVKPNQNEAARALDIGIDQTSPEALVRYIAHRIGRPACTTLGKRGVLAFSGTDTLHVPGFVNDGPVDIVGAGDSLTAGMVGALCAGATFFEATLIGNLVASITVQQIGVTGTASPDQLRRRFAEYHDRYPELCDPI